MKTIARFLSRSILFAGAKRLLDRNMQQWNMPLGKLTKLWVGSYMILRDYADGSFPPRFDNEHTTFEAEKACMETLREMGQTRETLNLAQMRKPFWLGPRCSKYLADYVHIQDAFHQTGIHPPARLLEAGCGSGWVAEFLAATGFNVLATTLDSEAAELLERRRNGLAEKALPATLRFRATPMEYIQKAVSDLDPFDAVYVYEALHHAHDWRKTIKAFYSCLRPGGWCFIFNEPNLVHTFKSYRVARLTNTHEIGIRPGALKRQLRAVGFGTLTVLRHRVHGYMKPTWLAVRK